MATKNHRILLLFLQFVFICSAFSGEETLKPVYNEEKNISYRSESEGKTDEYIKERCTLNLYYPENTTGYATIIWIHGGGLEGGNSWLPHQFQKRGFAVVPIRYRLMPKVSPDKCIDDAAAAVAWVKNNIEKYGGDPSKIFVSGHSAGGYLTAMVGLDKKWLDKYGIDADSIAGYIPYSGQMTKHFNVRKYFKDKELHPVVDEWAPMFYIRKNAPPFLFITGDREKEIPARTEENFFMAKTLKLADNPDVTMYELEGHTHTTMVKGAHQVVLNWIKAHLKK